MEKQEVLRSLLLEILDWINMARWKIINKDKAEKFGIGEINTDNEGFIIVDVTKLPHHLTVKDIIDFAEKEGIIIQTSI